MGTTAVTCCILAQTCLLPLGATLETTAACGHTHACAHQQASPRSNRRPNSNLPVGAAEGGVWTQPVAHAALAAQRQGVDGRRRGGWRGRRLHTKTARDQTQSKPECAKVTHPALTCCPDNLMPLPAAAATGEAVAGSRGLTGRRQGRSGWRLWGGGMVDVERH